MARKDKKDMPPGLAPGLATTVKVDAGPRWQGLQKQGLKQRITGVAQRFLPLRRPAVGLAPHHANRPSPNPARYANMASAKSSKFTFKNFRFSIVFALLLGLAGAGGYAMMGALSKSFHKVTNLVDYNRWVKPSPNRSSHLSSSRSEASRTFFSSPSSSSERSHPSIHHSSALHRSGKHHRFARGTRVRDPFYKDHHPLSKKHAVKHRKWSKKLAKLKKKAHHKYHTASHRAKRARGHKSR